ncbi:MAG: chemotaxis protein CheW [Burkholderiaceae bacterium]
MHAPEPQAQDSPRTRRFGVRIDGLPVVLPEGLLLEFLPRAVVWRLPLAPARVAGLMQLRGHPLPVFDIGRTIEPGHSHPAVLIIGEPARALALIVDEAPQPVCLQPPGPPGSAANGDADAEPHADAEPSDTLLRALAGDFICPEALGDARRDESDRLWWPLDPAVLGASLANETADV